MHQLFASLFPETGDRETKVIVINGPETGIPPGVYAILEYYCVDENCDCRQVYLRIVKKDTKDMENDFEAEISFGWESANYYIKWFGKTDDSLNDFKGPSLNILAKQGSAKKQWLKMISHLLKTDKKYVKRLESHYRMVKK